MKDKNNGLISKYNKRNKKKKGKSFTKKFLLSSKSASTRCASIYNKKRLIETDKSLKTLNSTTSNNIKIAPINNSTIRKM